MESLEDRAPTTITFKPAVGKAKQHRGFSAPREHALESVVHADRFSPVTIGLWLGGAGMGIGGCLLGALMPYRQPVAVAISVLWWGIYFGCFGASVGALVGVITNRRPLRRWTTWDAAGMAPTELGLDGSAAGSGQVEVIGDAAGDEALGKQGVEDLCPHGHHHRTVEREAALPQ
jgi:hypothetical protein